MTVTLTDVLLLVIAGTLLVMALQLARMGGRVIGAADALKDTLYELRPELRRLVRDTEAAVAEVRRAGGRIDRIAGMVEGGVALAQHLFAPLSMRLAALITGVKTAVVALRRVEFHEGNGAESARRELK